jgi:hypothetical protein
MIVVVDSSDPTISALTLFFWFPQELQSHFGAAIISVSHSILRP